MKNRDIEKEFLPETDKIQKEEEVCQYQSILDYFCRNKSVCMKKREKRPGMHIFSDNYFCFHYNKPSELE